MERVGQWVDAELTSLSVKVSSARTLTTTAGPAQKTSRVKNPVPPPWRTLPVEGSVALTRSSAVFVCPVAFRGSEFVLKTFLSTSSTLSDVVTRPKVVVAVTVAPEPGGRKETTTPCEVVGRLSTPLGPSKRPTTNK